MYFGPLPLRVFAGVVGGCSLLIGLTVKLCGQEGVSISNAGLICVGLRRTIPSPQGSSLMVFHLCSNTEIVLVGIVQEFVFTPHLTLTSGIAHFVYR